MLAAAAALLARGAWAKPNAQPVHIDDPPAGCASIVFYRKWAYPGGANSYAVRDGQTILGMLGPGTYFVAIVEPGLHTYSMRAERRNDMQIEVEAGEVYYVRFELETGWILYQPTLTPSEQRLFDEVSSRLRLAEPVAPTKTAPGATERAP